MSIPQKISVVLLSFSLAAAPAASKDVDMPDFQGITQWLNTDKPLSKVDLKGKVVLVDFWTYSCINCIRTLPHVTGWHDQYADQGLVIVGLHTPEFSFEKKVENVKDAIAKYGIRYPVAMDNDYKTWRAYSNRYWPAHYLVDKKGVVRYIHFGEGKYAEMEAMIQKLLAEGAPAAAAGAESKTKAAISEADLSHIKTPEIYLGHERLEYLGNRDMVQPDKKQEFREPKTLANGKFYLAGEWKVAAQFAELAGAPGKILIRYDAGKANMVLGTADGREISAEVWIDGRPATAENKGADVALEKGRALCRIKEPRLYHLTRTPQAGTHTLELRFAVPGVQAYTFTFG